MILICIKVKYQLLGADTYKYQSKVSSEDKRYFYVSKYASIGADPSSFTIGVDVDVFLVPLPLLLGRRSP